MRVDGEIRVDLSRRQVFLGEREIRLTPLDYKLLFGSRSGHKANYKTAS